MARAKSPEDVLEAALTGLNDNPRDLGFVMLYRADTGRKHDFGSNLSVDGGRSLKARTQPESIESSNGYSRATPVDTNGDEEAEIEFHLAGTIGAIDTSDIDEAQDRLPRLVTSSRSNPVDEHDEMSLTKMIKLAHQKDNLILFQGADMKVFGSLLRPNCFGDIPHQVVVLPIRASERVSSEESIQGILVVGLNTRLYVSSCASCRKVERL
jgi:hypothetical protein